MGRIASWKRRGSVTNPMRRSLYLLVGCGLVAAAALGWRLVFSSSAPELPTVQVRDTAEAAPMCPWREPHADLRRFFPGANGYRTETRILSGERVELQRRLGRPPTGEEHTLYLHRVYAGREPQGTVLTRRLRGDYGAIELVLAVDAGGRIRDLRLQRLREPETVAAALRSERFRGALLGRTGGSDWGLEPVIAQLPPEARPSATAIAEAARTQLILLQVAERRSTPASPHH